ncbi:Huntingtin-interacting protein 1 [Eumeta japonica]|uniref:Huntingtin-interacting protein 1 n=1 Tax=Eumeta variegata TaxID=151549 RepID=A0A4C1SDU7_EUMVA|nr:Huntingtin-interacting protein 1 [Eumeta japonica]
MTPQGQCRLAPLITLIQDSNPLYDICVRIMFRLHDGLPHDVLMGHRNRFNEIFKRLKTFYENVRPLQYFSDIIQLPHLPESAPNFSSELDLGNYQAPIMVLPQEPEPETESTVDSLVNVTDNISVAENVLEEKELIIRQLTDALNEKQMALEHFPICHVKLIIIN